jgi:D-beta-D-heptose 7-phosphate kinase/D-beta-D-heptose 1-phosphate adenosyltransferase
MDECIGVNIVFTNGCYDLLHPGHIEGIQRIKQWFPNSWLVIGLNSDESVKRIKGPTRPIYNQDERRAMLLAIKGVDEVIIFDETTPSNLITRINPDILVKGDDYYKESVVGYNSIKEALVIMKRIGGYSTTNIIRKITDINSSPEKTEDLFI